MAYLGQKRLGPELITNAQEAWLGYYVFAALTLLSLAGGFWVVRRAELEPGLQLVAQIGVLLLGLVSAGIATTCHIAGHLLDELAAMRNQPPPGGSEG